MRSYAVLSLVLLAAVPACKTADPVETPDGAPRPDATLVDADMSSPDAVDVDADPGCMIPSSDYQPRLNGSADDEWPVCISDDNTYHPLNASISTIARVGAFEQIATLLFTGTAPSQQVFIDARVQYNLSEGLASRVQRREDEHYPPVLGGAGTPVACTTLTPTLLAANAARCVGPAQIGPLLEDAFSDGQSDGATDLQRRVAAARIEAGLLWFLYQSAYKEVTTCAQTPRDCDSGWAYYSGGNTREVGRGLSRYVRALDADTHDRVWDGALAIRCWRDLDNPTGVATNLAMRDRARTQLDTAMLRGIAQLVRDRTGDLSTATGDARVALWELLAVLGPVLDREATARDAGNAAALRAEFARTDPAQVDTAAVLDAIDEVFPCN